MRLFTTEETILTWHLTNPYPAEAGHISYAVTYSLDSDMVYLADSREVKLVTVDEEFETPEGIASGRFHYIYYAPGIGIVGQIVRRETFQNQLGDVRARILLHDYCLKA